MSDDRSTPDLTKQSLVAILAVSLALANVLAAKLAWFELPIIGGVAVPAGFVGIGVAFLASDLLSELYGKAVARRAVNGTIVALVIGWGLIYSALLMPAAPFWQDGAAYQATLGSGSTIVIASVLSLLVSQNVDVSVFHRLKSRFRSRVIRNVGSTAVSQAVDTVLFIGLAFWLLPMVLAGSPQSLGALTHIMLGQYIVKLGIVVLDTPVFITASSVMDNRIRGQL